MSLDTVAGYWDIQFRSLLLVSKTGFYLLTWHQQKWSKFYPLSVLKMLKKHFCTFFRNHLLDQICTTILDGENVDLSKVHLVLSSWDWSWMDLLQKCEKLIKIGPEQLNYKVCQFRLCMVHHGGINWHLEELANDHLAERCWGW